MSRKSSCSLFALAALTACATSPDATESPAAGRRAVPVETSAAPGEGRPEGAAAQGGTAQRSAQDPELQAMIASIWREPGFQRQLAQSYLRGSEIDPPLTVRQAELRQEVLELIQENELENAAARLQNRQGSDETAVFDYLLGNIYLTQEKWAAAVDEYTKAVAKYPSYLRAYRSMALAQMRLEDYAGAARSFAEVIRLGGNDAMTWGMLATVHARNGDYVAAEAGFRMVSMLEPDRRAWRLSLVSTLFGQGRYAEGASLLGSLLQEDPNNPDLWLRQARAFAQMNQQDKAAENLEIVDQLGGSTFQSLSMLGAIYFNDGLYELCVDAYLRAIALPEKGGHEGVLQVANRLAAASAYDESKRLVLGLEQAYADALDGDDKTAMLKLRARLADASGATEEQVALLQQIVQENPLDGDALLQLGRYYQQAGDPEKAIFRYEQAAQNEAFASRAKVLHARVLVDQDKFAEALPLLRDAQRLDPRDDVQRLLEYVERNAARPKAGGS